MTRSPLPVVVLLLMAPLAHASVDNALDALHASGQSLTSLAADLKLTTVSGDLGDETSRTGRFLLRRLPDGDTQARISFAKRTSGKKIFPDRHDYVLSGPNLIDRDYAAKKQVTRQVRSPGEKIDLFKLGEGPFPLPIGQPREAVLKQFDVTEDKNDDPTALAVLTLRPKANTPMAEKFKWIRVVVDKATKLPRVVTTTDKAELDQNAATLTNVRVNDAVKDTEFTLEPVDEKEWSLVSTK